MTDPALQIEDIRTGYSGVDVLHGISLSVDSGEIVGLFGPNGAGKSTLLKAISGLLPLSSGRICLEGRDIAHTRVEERVSWGLACVPEGRRVFPGLTVLENLKTARLRNGERLEDRLKFVYDLFPVLSNRARQRAWSLSGGEQQMLSLGRALMSSPSVLLMDEPSLGLAPQLVVQLFEKLVLLALHGLAILVVEQNVNVATRYINRFAVLKGGILVGHSDVNDPNAIGLLEEAYLGIAGSSKLML